jgi:hypothetical protein
MTIGGNANHVILIVDLADGPVFLDPTDRSVAYGTLPYRDQNAPILPVSEAGDPLMTTPGSDAAQNWRETELNLELAPDGSAEGEFKFTALGTFADGIREELIGQPEGRRPKVVTGYLGGETLEVTDLNGVAALEPPDAKTPLVVSGALSPTHLAANESAAVLLRLSAFASGVSVVSGEGRTSPLLLGAKRRLKATVKVVVPAGVEPVSLPPASTLEYPFAKARLTWGFAEGTLTMERTLEYTQSQVPASESAAYEKFARALNAASATPIQLKKGGGS